jgi:hypothetical protein
MRRRIARESLPEESVLKIDKDCHVDWQLERDYLKNSISILEERHLRVEWIKATRTRHGRHYYIKIDPPVDATTANRLQYLLGDDPRRVGYNEARIESGLREWNKLFEAVGRRMETIYRCPDRANMKDHSVSETCVLQLLVGSG